MKRLVLFVLIVSFATTLRADVVSDARQTAIAGDRARALRMLEMRLLENPRDHDARTLYGTVLSWERDYERARFELRTVIAADPRNLDALIALARVELWSGNRAEADRIATEVLRLDPSNGEVLTLRTQARSVDSANEWTAGANYDDYDDSDAWREGYVALKLAGRRGAIIGRVSRAERFDLDDMQFEVEAYPRISASTYAFLSVGATQDGELYPDHRFGAEIYRTFARVWEASAGARRLEFDDPATVYTVSLNRYAGNWLLGGRVYRADEETSAFAMIRRYFGEHGQFAGVRFGRGIRDDLRSSADIDSLTTSEISAEAFLSMTARWFLNLRAGVGDDRKSAGVSLSRRF